MSGAGKGLTGRAGMLWVALSCELRTAPDKRKPIIRSGIRPGISECIISLGQSHLILRFGQAKTGRVEALHDLRKESGTEVGKMAKPGRPVNGYSERRACITSMRAARAAGSQDATTAAASSTNAERITGKAPGIFTSKK